MTSIAASFTAALLSLGLKTVSEAKAKRSESKVGFWGLGEFGWAEFAKRAT